MLFGYFPRGDANDPSLFVRGMTEVLAQYADYPEEIFKKVISPTTGLPSRLQWLPSIKEVKDACLAALQPIWDEEDRQQRRKQQFAEREEFLLAQEKKKAIGSR
jgi:hypothetical protein